MEYQDFVKRNNRAVYVEKKRVTVCYYPLEQYTEETRHEVTIVSNPFNDKRQFRSINDWCYGEDLYVRVKNENGKIFEVDVEDLIPLCHIADLDRDELIELGERICFGSIYLADYNNDFFIDPKEVSDYADAYIETLPDETWTDLCSAQGFADFVLS